MDLDWRRMYDRCDCGRQKAKAARQCRECWKLRKRREGQHQYDHCGCGAIKAKQARQCKRCWDLHRRKLEWLKQRRKNNAGNENKGG